MQRVPKIRSTTAVVSQKLVAHFVADDGHVDGERHVARCPYT